MKKLAFASFALALTLSAYAADATGKWNGKIVMDLSSIKKMIQKQAASAPADKKAGINQQIAMMDKTEKMMGASTIVMELKKDGSVSISQTTGGKSQSDKAKWSQSGNKIKITGMGAKQGGPSEMIGTVGPTGKTLYFDLSDQMKKEAAKRGAPAGMSGKMALSFTKG